MTVVDLDTRRRDKIGGSEAAAACGVDPHRSRIMLWAEKTGRVERAESEPMKWGTLLQPVIFAELERQGYDVLPCPDAEWSHAEWPWLVGHPDGFAQVDGERAVLEIKTAGYWSGGEWEGDDAAPLQYVVQCYHYMALTGCNATLLACLVGGQRLEVWTVEWVTSVGLCILKLEEAFRRYVRTDTPPPPDGSDSAHNAIRALHPKANGKTIRLDGETWRDVKQLRGLREQRKEIERQEAELQQRVELAMGDATQAVSPFDTPAARWSNVRQRRFDTAAFKTDHAALYDEYAVAKPTRRFTLE